jgi:nesprin-1
MDFTDRLLCIADEHERVQKKVFTNWINYYVPDCIHQDIILELRDGTKLIALIEALTGVKLVCISFQLNSRS